MAQQKPGLMLTANSTMKFDSLSKTNKTTGYYEIESFSEILQSFIHLVTASIQNMSLNFVIARQGVIGRVRTDGEKHDFQVRFLKACRSSLRLGF